MFFEICVIAEVTIGQSRGHREGDIERRGGGGGRALLLDVEMYQELMYYTYM